MRSASVETAARSVAFGGNTVGLDRNWVSASNDGMVASICLALWSFTVVGESI